MLEVCVLLKSKLIPCFMLLNGSFALGASGGKGEGGKLKQNCKDLLKLHKVCLALIAV